MEFRHLRYFVAVAEEGSFTQAAQRRLHTAQPSLSRQIRDLEETIGTRLINRLPRGMSLTPAGEVFLAHARQILAQVETATEATRRAARPAKQPFIVGFLTGHEIGWLPTILDILGEHLQTVELTIHSAPSPALAQALAQGKMDLAFLRPANGPPELEFRLLMQEELFVLLPADHRLAKRRAIRPADIPPEAFITFSQAYSPALRQVIDDVLRRAGLDIAPVYEAETLAMVISLLLSTNGVTFLPVYMKRLLPRSVVARPFSGRPPTIPLALGYNRSNPSALLRHVLSQIDAFSSRTDAPPL